MATRYHYTTRTEQRLAYSKFQDKRRATLKRALHRALDAMQRDLPALEKSTSPKGFPYLRCYADGARYNILYSLKSRLWTIYKRHRDKSERIDGLSHADVRKYIHETLNKGAAKSVGDGFSPD